MRGFEERSREKKKGREKFTRAILFGGRFNSQVHGLIRGLKVDRAVKEKRQPKR